MARLGRNATTPERMNKRARKLAEALAARRELPPDEVNRLAQAEDAFERQRKQALKRLEKPCNPIANPANPRMGSRGRSKSASFRPK